MNRILKGIAFLVFTIAFVSCNKDNSTDETPIVPYAEQYPKDLAAIDKFLDEYYLIVDDATFDVSFKKIETLGDSLPIRTQTDYPLLFKTVKSNDVDYKVYYINITKKGINSSDPDYFGTIESPTKVDSVYVTYKGRLLNNTSFDETVSPIWMEMTRLIKGWGEILPEFKTGNHVYDDTTGNVTYSGFGSGIMFLPSGLGYYNNYTANISAYAPLIFNFKLMKLNYVDHDYDRIDSRFEINIGADGKFADTDGDEYPDYLDGDDDNDGYSTKNEIKNPLGGYYDFNSIPTCSDGKKRHLTKNCHN